MKKASCRAVLIAGQTASGKSAVALRMAEEFNGVIVNADSMQVYRELLLLSARPTAEDESRAPHKLYGFVPASERYSVGRWVEDVQLVLEEIWQEGQLPVIVGGTGLYFRALLEGLSEIPEIPDHIRRKWFAVSDEDPEALHPALKALDPQMAQKLKPGDRQRMVRALEVIEATGKSIIEWQARPGKPVLAKTDVARFVLSPDRPSLYARCDQRFENMIDAGALQEVSGLMELDLDPGLPAMRAIGVPPLIDHLKGEISLDEASCMAATQTRQYAKRQMTWLKGNMITWNWIYAQQMEKIWQEILPLMSKDC